jgi:alkyl hydroperoxide reductase subunit AhpF
MPLLNEQVRKDVRQMLGELHSPVTLKVFTQAFECDYCKETRSLAEEVAALSDKLTVEVYDLERDQVLAKALHIERIPAIALIGAKDYGVRIFGIPSGYEFGSLIEGIRLVSEGTSGLAQAARDMVAKLTRPVHIQVFITPT